MLKLLFFIIVLLLSYSNLYADVPYKNFYIVGEYGLIQKYNNKLILTSENKIKNLVRRYRVCDVDIAPDSDKLFLAVSTDKSPLIIIRTADLSEIDNKSIVYNPIPKPFLTYSPRSILAVSNEYVYMDDECYTAEKEPFSNIMINIPESRTKKISSSLSLYKKDIQISPQGKKMVSINNGTLFMIDTASGNIVNSVDLYFKGKGEFTRKTISLEMDWGKEEVSINSIIMKNDHFVTEKLSVDLKKNTEFLRVEEGISEKANFAHNIKTKPLANSSCTYVNDSTGRLLVFDGKKNKFVKNIDVKSFHINEQSCSDSYLSPDEKYLFCQINKTKQLTPNYEKDVSELYIFDMATKKIAKKLEYPEGIVSVLFDK